ncbi:MAG: o-succinylbenzoate synthase [Salinibacter sp.]
MTIDSVDLYRYTLPLRDPLVLGEARVSERRGLLIRLTLKSGAEGWGEAAPLPEFSAESMEAVTAHARRLRARWAGHPLPAESPDALLEGIPVPKALPASLRFAAESAVVEAVAGARDVSPARLLGASRTRVALNALVRAASPQAVSQQGRQLRAAGYQAVKLKVGRAAVSLDVERVHALREALGDAIDLRLDANRAWSAADARSFLAGIHLDDVAYIEEPVSDVTRLPALVEDTGCPVALDETTREQSPDVLRMCPVRAVVLKPTLLGGVTAARQWAAAARRQGASPVVSASYEAGVGTRMLTALAAALPETPVGLSPYTRLAADVLSPRLAMRRPVVDLERMARANVVEAHLAPIA